MRAICNYQLIKCFAATLAMLLLGQPLASDAFDKATAPLLEQYCSDCHANGAAEGGLSFDKLSADLQDAATFAQWERVYDRVAGREMPPADAPQLSDADHEALMSSLRPALEAAHSAAKGAVLRRLNRREYQNTLNDMFGVSLDLEGMLPEDGRSHEFDNVGSALSVSLVHLKQYIEAAGAVMEAAIATTTEAPEPTTKTVSYADTREGKTHIGKSWKLLDDGAVVFFRSGGYPSGMLRDANARTSGRYRIRVKAYAHQSESPITFAIGATTFQRGAAKPTFAYRAAPPNQPTIVEVEGWMDERYMVEITPWGIHDSQGVIRKQGIDAYRGPGLAIVDVELTGPLIDEFPTRGHKLIYDGISRYEIEPSNPQQKTKSWYQPQFKVETSDPPSDARHVLLRIARRAFRRPVESAEVERYVQLTLARMNDGATFDEALRTGIAAILASPDFLYFREPSGWLDDYAIATRLAYFLTRTAPDEPLLASAAQGALSTKPDVLLGHVRRLLDKPEHQRFVVDFTDAWLNLREIEFTNPDSKLFPEFDQFLQFSMLEETRSYFDVMIKENLSIDHLVHSDFAMLNNRLALHYGIDGVDGPGLRKVKLSSDSVRGGLLSQGSVLKVSANGTNTSPVVRGVWVMERILGQTPPPPPAGIPGVEPDIRGAATLRELLDKHRNLDSCRTCHQMIDPPGFALESFNPIGGWRERYRSLGDGERVETLVNGRNVRYRLGPSVDASGQLKDAAPFAGYRAFRDQLAERDEVLARTLIVKLLTFATGREMGFSDRSAIDQLVERSQQSGHGLRNMIELVAASEIFRRK